MFPQSKENNCETSNDSMVVAEDNVIYNVLPNGTLLHLSETEKLLDPDFEDQE